MPEQPDPSKAKQEAGAQYDRIFSYFLDGIEREKAPPWTIPKRVERVRRGLRDALRKRRFPRKSRKNITEVGPFLLDAQAELMPFSLDITDRVNMRRYIEYLMCADVRVALGQVFRMTKTKYEKQSDVSEQHKSTVLELMYDFLDLLRERCGGKEANTGQMRLRTLLRYMLERDYQQGTMAAEAVCDGDPLLCADADGNVESWSLSLESGDLVFDLGCGPGKTLDIFEAKAGKGNVVGIDINPLDAMRDDRIRIGIIDTSQAKISIPQGGRRELLSFENYFGKAGLVFAELVVDRVADQSGFFLNCKMLLRPGGTLAIGLLLPVKGEDDEPDLASHRIQYVFDPLTAGNNQRDDFLLIAKHLQQIGFVDVRREKLLIRDPVTGCDYRNHFLLIARKGEG